VNRLALILLVLLAVVGGAMGAGYYSNAWPAATHSTDVFTAYSGTVVRVTGSTDVFTNSTGWTFITTNLPAKLFRTYQPATGMWLAQFEQSNTYVKTAAPWLSNTVSISSVTNSCVTNGFTNACIAVTSVADSYRYAAPTQTTAWQTTIAQTAGCAVCVSTYSNTLHQIDPCEVALVLTNIVISTNAYQWVVCATNPGTATATIPANTSGGYDCGKTNVVQWVATDYTAIQYSNGDVVVDFALTTNWNLSVWDAWTYDTTLAGNERQDALGQTMTWQALQTMSRTVWENLPVWKSWVLANAGSFVLTNAVAGGTFNDYLSVLLTNRVWQGPTSNMWYDGSSFYDVITTNFWGTNFTARTSPPTWNDTMYLDGASLVTVAPSIFSPPVDLQTKLCTGLGLPYQRVGVTMPPAIQHWNVPGWQVGHPEVNTTNIVTNVTMYATAGGYFDWTPDRHFVGALSGRGHLVTNRWDFTDQWLRFARVDYGSTDDGGHTGGWTVAAIPAAFDVASTNTVVTNSLAIEANTFLNVAAPYYSNGWTHLTENGFLTMSNSWPQQAQSTALYTKQVSSLTNYPVSKTNSVTLLNILPPQTNVVTCAVVSNRCVLVTNVFTFLPSVSITNTFAGSNLTGSVSFTVPTVVTNYRTCCGTNSLTNVVTSTSYSQTVAVVNWIATNTVAVALTVTRMDWTNSNTYTPHSFTCRGSQGVCDYNFVWTPTLAIFTNYPIFSVTLTNGLMSTNVSAVFTNWNVAAGYHEQDYEYDGIRALVNPLTVIFAPLTWYAQDASGTNRYGPYMVSDYVALTNAGAFVPSSVTTDTLANAQAAIVFTANAGSGAPWGASYAHNSDLGFHKDVWQFQHVELSANIGDTVTVFVASSFDPANPPFCSVAPYPYPYRYCDSGCTDEWGSCSGTCSNSTSAMAEAQCKNTLASFYPTAACGCVNIPPPGPPGPSDYGYWDIRCNAADPTQGVATVITTCDDLKTVAGMISNQTPITLDVDSNCVWIGMGSVLPSGGGYTFWHGTTAPTNFDYCCEQAGIALAGNVSWVNITNDVVDTSATAYGWPPSTNGILAYTLYQPQQSSAGLFADITKSFSSVRDVYLAPTLPGVSTVGYYNTSVLPVPASITPGTRFVTNDYPAATGDCTNSFSEMMPHQYTYRQDITTYPTPLVTTYFYATGSNVNCIVTNLAWPSPTIWKGPTIGAWNSTTNIAFLQRFSTATGNSNAVVVPDFLNQTPIIGGPVLDNTPYGWGVGGGWLLLNFTDGFGYK